MVRAPRVSGSKYPRSAHRADQPSVVGHFFDADRMTGANLTEIDFLMAQADATAVGDHGGFVVKGIADVRQTGVMG